jgi:hypothetical protein
MAFNAIWSMKFPAKMSGIGEGKKSKTAISHHQQVLSSLQAAGAGMQMEVTNVKDTAAT